MQVFSVRAHVDMIIHQSALHCLATSFISSRMVLKLALPPGNTVFGIYGTAPGVMSQGA